LRPSQINRLHELLGIRQSLEQIGKLTFCLKMTLKYHTESSLSRFLQKLRADARIETSQLQAAFVGHGHCLRIDYRINVTAIPD
jgi:hypothetical protein